MAKRLRKPLVVGVGCAPPADKRWVIAITSDLEGYDGPCIVVSRPAGQDLVWLVTLPPTADAAMIATVLGRQQAEPPPRVIRRVQSVPMFRGQAANC
jgi:hypothetical protein